MRPSRPKRVTLLPLASQRSAELVVEEPVLRSKSSSPKGEQTRQSPTKPWTFHLPVGLLLFLFFAALLLWLEWH
jgi:hypothetical protein